MKLYTTLTAHELSAIAEDCHVEIAHSGNMYGDLRTRGRNAGKRFFQLTLRPTREIRDDGNHWHQRESAGYMTAGRKVHAVCWHGHTDFMTRVFADDPNARLESCLQGAVVYDGAEDFLAKYVDTAFINIGPPIAPVSVASACRCGFADTADHRLGGMLSDRETA